jgi:deazaflavin-dependent oxidoreductase (nitroreductase family)
MTFGNKLVAALLRSPLHPLLSGSTDLIRYTGRRSGQQFTTPTQYARDGADVIILVARPQAKTWWRNFKDGGDLKILLQGHWVPMTARAIVGTDEQETLRRLLNTYLLRFPKATRALGSEADGAPTGAAVIVRCQPLGT